MGFLENLRNGLLGDEVKAFPLLWPDFRGQPQWRTVDVESYIHEGFNLNSIVYSSIMYKARAITSVPLKAYTGDINKPTLLSQDHPLTKLARRPNHYQSYPEFQALCLVYMNISGDCFVYLEREDDSSYPTAMHPLKPTNVKIIPKKGKNGGFGLAGYLYTSRGVPDDKGEKILPRDMIHIKLPNPQDELGGMGYGLSPLSAAARNADVANSINDFLKLFFEKGVVLPGVLITEQPLNAKSIARIRERWKEVFGGYRNWAEEIGILERGTEYQRVGLTFDEMGLEGLDMRNESKITAPFGVPPILIGAEVALAHSSYKDIPQARKVCWEDTIIPELTLFESEFQYSLRSKTEDAWVAFDYSSVPALLENVKDQVDAAYKLQQMGFPANDATRAVGLRIDPTEIGEYSFVPVNMAPVLKEGQELPTIGPPIGGNYSEPLIEEE